MDHFIVTEFFATLLSRYSLLALKKDKPVQIAHAKDRPGFGCKSLKTMSFVSFQICQQINKALLKELSYFFSIFYREPNQCMIFPIESAD